MKSNPAFRNLQKLSENASIKRNAGPSGIITIPVVVHVIYNHSGENLSDAQIQSQIDVLNEDFRRLNADADNLWGQAADAEIEFCLASRDPYGDATCGITRTQTDSIKFYSKFTMKSSATGGIDPWPYQDYLNIWVCDISGLLGFARFPEYSDPELYDGVVTDYLSFGRIGNLKEDFNLGRTTTHEVGHWLNLRHIWGDGDCFYDDFVSDTPVSDDHNYGCNPGHISCGSVDMVQNYMDYSDDVCMNLFTIGQKNRMRALFEPGGFRTSLLTSKGCGEPLECNKLFLTINFDDYPADISWVLRNAETSETVMNSVYYPNTLANTSLHVSTCVPDGTYSFSIDDSYGDGLCCNEGTGSYTLTSTYEDLIISNGQLGSGETTEILVNNSNYRFIGPGSNWYDPANWNKLDPPSDCYEGLIIIEKYCERSPFELKSTNSIIVRQGAELRITE
ncbi:hypothetical protein GCM10007940_09650 [Portibacter lacus]|uniref:Peptidase M43 pregnancy-associated plasma-A domain-containing protein n=2 Tax=Portibacter lacus TaxID=1099794 RepID=A0AA37WEQ4_9BACT|nr:hypothetical protein GCM10007940_09650 [Portibacter lacus]